MLVVESTAGRCHRRHTSADADLRSAPQLSLTGPVAESTRAIEFCRGPSRRALLEELLSLRSSFVSTVGWFAPGHYDRDEYDEHVETIHVAVRDRATRAIVAAMRLTPVTAAQHSLSWSMFNALDVQTPAPTPLDTMWDATRLVCQVDGGFTEQAIVESFTVLYGFGIGLTATSQEGNTRWVFTATKSMTRHLRRLGIHHDVVHSARISVTDADDSYFCVANPHAIRHAIMHSPLTPAFTRHYFSAGLALAERELRESVYP